MMKPHRHQHRNRLSGGGSEIEATKVLGTHQSWRILTHSTIQTFNSKESILNKEKLKWHYVRSSLSAAAALEEKLSWVSESE
jgi:hypothetical protein